MIPVNPMIAESLGEKAYPTLSEVPEKIDIVNVFRRSEFVPEVVDEAIRLGVPAIWMQEGVVHEDAAAKARAAGIFVVMDRCILKEHRRYRAVGRKIYHRDTEAQRNSSAFWNFERDAAFAVCVQTFSDFYFSVSLCLCGEVLLSFLISSSRALMRFSMPSSVGW